MTKIEWTERTWNPIVGCSLVSPGCTNCYAMQMAYRLAAMTNESFQRGHGATTAHYLGTVQRVNGHAVWTGKVRLASDATILAPLKRRKPTMYFVNSMGDLFHEQIPDAWIDRVFAVMALAPQHTFQVLTKRSARMRDYLTEVRETWCHRGFSTPGNERIHEAALAITGEGWLPETPGEWPLKNVWLGVSTEDQARAYERIPDLLATPAAVRFISAEPLLGPIDLSRWLEMGGLNTDLGLSNPGLDWVIAGGESGTGARPMHPDWARSLRDQCAAAGTPFFFKQWGAWKDGSDFATDDSVRIVCNDGRVLKPDLASIEVADRVQPVPPAHPTMMRRVGKARAGRLLDGVEHNGMPAR